ncbi:hypothetical protein V2S66_13870 [Streptomyces sp. V4-01]|uniref:Uncharacterized protein n=1 Tax=Actinacidiphila polyblastidii TaxID=3110430 RepID=A0ABU7PB70_9ACTN|nr:hypothetical protein [Streptomyces sp. V4-01]
MDSQTVDLFARPRYWLMYALPWPERGASGGMAEAAHVIAPPTVDRRTRGAMSGHAADMLDYVELYAREHDGQRLIWFTDVTRWLEWEKGRSWADLGVDWQQALGGLQGQPLLGLYMTISQRAHFHLINTAEVFELHSLDGTSEILTDEERAAVRADFTRKLDSDWPRYIRDMIALGRLHVS